MTLRLDPERHTRLKLTAVHHRMSAQTLMTVALDNFLDTLAPTLAQSGCSCMGQTDPNKLFWEKSGKRTLRSSK